MSCGDFEEGMRVRIKGQYERGEIVPFGTPMTAGDVSPGSVWMPMAKIMRKDGSFEVGACSVKEGDVQLEPVEVVARWEAAQSKCEEKVPPTPQFFSPTSQSNVQSKAKESK